MGRTDDMLVIRGVNVFPSQVETILVKVKGILPHYMLVVDRVNSTDTLEIQVEVSDELMNGPKEELEKVRKYIADQVKSVLLLKAVITLVPDHTLTRFEGKSKHIIDKRVL